MVTVGDPFAEPFLDYTKSGGQKTGHRKSYPIMLPPGGDFDAAFEDMRSKRIDAIIVTADLACVRASRETRAEAPAAVVFAVAAVAC